jgi:hypothetical protein
LTNRFPDVFPSALALATADEVICQKELRTRACLGHELRNTPHSLPLRTRPFWVPCGGTRHGCALECHQLRRNVDSTRSTRLAGQAPPSARSSVAGGCVGRQGRGVRIRGQGGPHAPARRCAYDGCALPLLSKQTTTGRLNPRSATHPRLRSLSHAPRKRIAGWR